MRVNHDAVISIMAGADAPMTAAMVAEALESKNMLKVRGILLELVRDETLSRAGSRYRMREAGKYDAPARSGGNGKEVPKTEVAARASRKEKGLAPGGQASRPETIAPSWPKPSKGPIRGIKNIEQAEKAAEVAQVANPGEVTAALDRLKINIRQTAVLNEPEIKQEMLRQLAAILEPSIADQCRELDDWITKMLSMEKN